MLGLNIAFPGNSAYCRDVQKLDGCEVGGVELVEGNRVDRKSVWNPWNLRNEAAERARQVVSPTPLRAGGQTKERKVLTEAAELILRRLWHCGCTVACVP